MTPENQIPNQALADQNNEINQICDALLQQIPKPIEKFETDSSDKIQAYQDAAASFFKSVQKILPEPLHEPFNKLKEQFDNYFKFLNSNNSAPKKYESFLSQATTLIKSVDLYYQDPEIFLNVQQYVQSLLQSETDEKSLSNYLPPIFYQLPKDIISEHILPYLNGSQISSLNCALSKLGTFRLQPWSEHKNKYFIQRFRIEFPNDYYIIQQSADYNKWQKEEYQAEQYQLLSHNSFENLTSQLKKQLETQLKNIQPSFVTYIRLFLKDIFFAIRSKNTEYMQKIFASFIGVIERELDFNLKRIQNYYQNLFSPLLFKLFTFVNFDHTETKSKKNLYDFVLKLQEIYKVKIVPDNIAFGLHLHQPSFQNLYNNEYLRTANIKIEQLLLTAFKEANIAAMEFILEKKTNGKMRINLVPFIPYHYHAHSRRTFFDALNFIVQHKDKLEFYILRTQANQQNFEIYVSDEPYFRILLNIAVSYTDKELLIFLIEHYRDLFAKNIERIEGYIRNEKREDQNIYFEGHPLVYIATNPKLFPIALQYLDLKLDAIAPILYSTFKYSNISNQSAINTNLVFYSIARGYTDFLQNVLLPLGVNKFQEITNLFTLMNTIDYLNKDLNEKIKQAYLIWTDEFKRYNLTFSTSDQDNSAMFFASTSKVNFAKFLIEQHANLFIQGSTLVDLLMKNQNLKNKSLFLQLIPFENFTVDFIHCLCSQIKKSDYSNPESIPAIWFEIVKKVVEVLPALVTHTTKLQDNTPIKAAHSKLTPILAELLKNSINFYIEQARLNTIRTLFVEICQAFMPIANKMKDVSTVIISSPVDERTFNIIMRAGLVDYLKEHEKAMLFEKVIRNTYSNRDLKVLLSYGFSLEIAKSKIKEFSYPYAEKLISLVEAMEKNSNYINSIIFNFLKKNTANNAQKSFVKEDLLFLDSLKNQTMQSFEDYLTLINEAICSQLNIELKEGLQVVSDALSICLERQQFKYINHGLKRHSNELELRRSKRTKQESDTTQNNNNNDDNNNRFLRL